MNFVWKGGGGGTIRWICGCLECFLWDFGSFLLYSSTFTPYDVYIFWLTVLQTFLHILYYRQESPWPARAHLEELRPFNQLDFILFWFSLVHILYICEITRTNKKQTKINKIQIHKHLNKKHQNKQTELTKKTPKLNKQIQIHLVRTFGVFFSVFHIFLIQNIMI